jgi:hypothetical protein
LKRFLANRFPGIGDQLELMAVAIDGEIYNDADYQHVGEATEIYFVPRTTGG